MSMWSNNRRMKEDELRVWGGCDEEKNPIKDHEDET
jgi:hypothetical protein